MRSAYPSTPKSTQRTPDSKDAFQDASRVRSSLPNLPDATTTASAPTSSTPVIPVNLVDAPTQRMCVFAIYGILFSLRVYDWWTLVQEETASLGYFVKWFVLDGIFLYGMPLMRIPWLEWSETTSSMAWILHAGMNAMLMFRVPVSSAVATVLMALLTSKQLPIEGWLIAMAKTFFDSEISVSEHSVRASNILHNSSLIMGKQIINVLPEG